ncbi:MAG: hypothetical protein JOZ62_01180, partial [Acidobacteriaceae bacterium]|nr:hypothetical protein [Acidobacteriaceae bacterium]
MTSDELYKETIEQQETAPSDDHLDRLLVGTDLEEPWYKSIIRGIRETLHPTKLPPLELTSKPVEDATLGDMNVIEAPWYRSLYTNIRDFVRPPKLPPLEVTSKPVEVGSIWGAYRGGETRSGIVSLLVHAGALVLLLGVFHTQVQNVVKRSLGPVVYVPPYKPKLPPAAQKAQGGGGGGMHQPKPVVRGVAPPQAPKQFTAPTFAIQHPKLPEVPKITAPAPPIVADNYGD